MIALFKLLFAFKYITFATEAFCDNFCISIVLKWFCEKKHQNKVYLKKFQIKSVDW